MPFLTFLARVPRFKKPAVILLSGQRLLPLAALAVGSFLCACAGSVSPTTKSTGPTNPPPPTTFSISGTITPATDGNGASLSLSGPSSASTTADASGNYSFSNLTNGSYVVTPSRSGYSFSPTQQAVTVNGANDTGVDFSASQQTAHSVSLSWQDIDSGISGYNIYRGTTDGGPYSRMNSTLLTTLSFTDTSVSSGITYYYVSTAVDSSGVESLYSNQATAKVP